MIARLSLSCGLHTGFIIAAGKCLHHLPDRPSFFSNISQWLKNILFTPDVFPGSLGLICLLKSTQEIPVKLGKTHSNLLLIFNLFIWDKLSFHKKVLLLWQPEVIFASASSLLSTDPKHWVVYNWASVFMGKLQTTCDTLLIKGGCFLLHFRLYLSPPWSSKVWVILQHSACSGRKYWWDAFQTQYRASSPPWVFLLLIIWDRDSLHGDLTFGLLEGS